MSGALPSGTGLAGAKAPEPPSRLGPTGGIPSARVLDACCGSRMFWFDREHPDALFVDNRSERHELTDKSSPGGTRSLIVEPDLVADFTALPFPDETFALVVFDPPHLLGAGAKGWLAKKYGKLGASWRDDLRAGFAECFRVLRPDGVLVFKWNEEDVRVSQILALTPHKPLFGNRCGKTAKSHWLVFMRPAQGIETGTGSVHESPTPNGGCAQ